MKRKKFPPSQLKRENISLKSIEIAEISQLKKCNIHVLTILLVRCILKTI